MKTKDQLTDHGKEIQRLNLEYARTSRKIDDLQSSPSKNATRIRNTRRKLRTIASNLVFKTQPELIPTFNKVYATGTLPAEPVNIRTTRTPHDQRNQIRT